MAGGERLGGHGSIDDLVIVDGESRVAWRIEDDLDRYIAGSNLMVDRR